MSEPVRACCCFLIEHKFVFGLLVKRNVTWLCAPQYLTCHIRNTTHHVYQIDAISHEATELDKINKWVDCREMKSGGEVNDQLTVSPQLGGIACNDTIHSRFFHGIESTFVCCSINLFAANDNGIESSFVCCSIKVSADNDKGRFNASPLGGLADQNDGRCDLMKPEKSAELPKDNFDLGTQ